MMKTIKIRFFKEKNNYFIQKKVFFGWKYITYTINLGYGSITNRYVNSSKEELLNDVLENHYKMDKRFVKVIEHATIKIH